MEQPKEIGGYFEFPEFHGKEYYPHLFALNLARTALLFLLQIRRYKKIYLPALICDSIIQILETNGYEISYYPVDQRLKPILPDELPSDSCLYIVNYYGQLPDATIRILKDQYHRIIVDHVHAFFQRPLHDVDTLYSCRKFFSISDGAYVSIGEDGTPDLETATRLYDSFPTDISHGRFTHVLGRYEESGAKYYQNMKAVAQSFYFEDIKKMSRLTKNLLRGIDYQMTINCRNNNYRVLKQVLSPKNPLSLITPEGPMCYPYYCQNGAHYRTALSKAGIYVPMYWDNVISSLPPERCEHRSALHILPLPCDQRYGERDMQHILYTLEHIHI